MKLFCHEFFVSWIVSNTESLIKWSSLQKLHGKNVSCPGKAGEAATLSITINKMRHSA
jgi:hypothetical protein